MSYTLTLHCGCRIYVACHPRTRIAHTRVVERRDPRCATRRHEVGTRLWLWELLPTATDRVSVAFEPEAPVAAPRERAWS
jgi:hypothetical protein